MTLDEFRREFQYLVGFEPPPLYIDDQGEALPIESPTERR
jgi:hypothetical protein